MIHNGKHGFLAQNRAILLGPFLIVASTGIAVLAIGPNQPGEPCPTSGPSKRLLEAVPGVMARIESGTGEDRARLLRDLLVKNDSGCSVSVELRPDLNNADYRFVVCQLVRELVWEDLNNEAKQVVLGAILEIVHQADLEVRIVAPMASHALRDPAPNIRSMAIRIFALEKSDEHARAIAECLDDSDSSVRRNALDALKELGSPLAIPKLVEQLGEPEPLRRFYAIQDLVKLDARTSVPQIERLLQDPNEDIRVWALRALYQFDDRRICTQLRMMIEQGEQSEAFNTLALAVCAKWGNTWPVPQIIERVKNRSLFMQLVLEELQVTGIAAPIIVFLRDPTIMGGDVWTDASIRSDAMQLLAKLDKVAAVPVLREYARNPESFPVFTAAALLGDLRAAEGVPELLSLLDNREKDYFALMALAKIARRDTVPAILARIRDKKDETTWRVLGYIARAADEALYERLTAPCEFKLLNGPLTAWVKGLSEQCGLRISLTNAIPTEFLARQLQECQNTTPMAVLDYLLLGVLNYSESRFALYLEGGVVHLGTIDEAIAFWDRRIGRP